MDDRRIIKSYVWHNDKCFFVSTIERDSSAAISPPPRYFETIAWWYDWEIGERGDMVAHAGRGQALAQYVDVCRQLIETGEWKDVDDV